MRSLKPPVLLLSLLALQSCATFVHKYGDFHPGGAAPEEEFPALRIYLTHNFSYSAVMKCDERQNHCPADAKVFSDADIAKAFFVNSQKMTFGYFGYEAEFKDKECSDFPDCDLRFLFRIKHGENAFAELLSKLVTIGSVGLIPTPFVVTYDFELKVYDRRNNLIGTYSRREKMTEWVHVGFLFFSKHGNRYSDSRKILYDVVGNMMLQMKAEKILRPPPI